VVFLSEIISGCNQSTSLPVGLQGSTPANQRAARGPESAGHGEDGRKSDDGDRPFLGIDPHNTSPAIRWPAPFHRALHKAGQSPMRQYPL